MNIHAYLLCYNEEMIIKNILDYYSGFCSKIFLLDNYSTDRSVEIAEGYPKVTIIPWKTADNKIDESKYVELKSELYKVHSRANGSLTNEVADWVISCDMDEVLYHPDIVTILKQYKDDGITVPLVTGIDVVGSNDLDQNLPIVDQYEYGERNVNFDKRIIFDCNFDISYSYGCHPKGPGFELMKNTFGYKSNETSELALLHYKKIGKRNIETAERNAARLDMSKIKKSSSGEFVGLGAHYLNIIQNYPNNKSNQKIFDNERKVLFENFSPSSGEQGSILNPYKGVELTVKDMILLLRLAEDLMLIDVEKSNQLINIVRQIRPEHPGVIRLDSKLKDLGESLGLVE